MLRRRPVHWSYLWRGLGDILLALLTPFPVALVLLFAYGVSTSTGAVTYSTVLQRRVPDAVRGRVFATLDAGVLVDRAGIAPGSWRSIWPGEVCWCSLGCSASRGQRRYAMCSIDALGIAAMLGPASRSTASAPTAARRFASG